MIPGPAVFIVEDEKIIALDLQERLIGMGYRVVGSATQGEEALEKVQELRPDLVLMDVVLRGEMDGVQTAEKITSQLRLPIIFITAYSDGDTIQRARFAEPYGYILKPFEDRELQSAIEIGLYKHAIETKLRESEARFRSVFDQSPIAMQVVDRDGRLLEANRACLDLFGVDHLEQMREFNLFDNPHLLGEREEQLRGGQTVEFESVYDFDLIQQNQQFATQRSGICYIKVFVAPWGVPGEPLAGYLTQIQDITSLKITEQDLIYRALHDILTGLPNRALFTDRLERAIERLKRHPGSLAALMFLDLDGFKWVNDHLGHAVGDLVLTMISRQMEECVRAGDTVARFGGDEFAILLEDICGNEDAIQVAERIQARLGTPTVLQGQEVRTTASIGIVMITAGSQRPEELLKCADIAMYRVKASGKAHYAIYA